MNTQSFPLFRKAWSLGVIFALSGSLVLLSLGQGDLAVKSSQAALPGEKGKIAYNQPPEGTCDMTALTLINPDGSGKETIPVHGIDPAWSPDGSKIAYWRGSGYLYVSNADGSNETSVAYYGNTSLGGPNPAWSPDGKKLVYAKLVSGYAGTDLFITDLESATETRLTHDGQDSDGLRISSTAPSWHPDPAVNRIAYWRFEQHAGGATLDGIWTIREDGSDAAPLVQDETSGGELFEVEYRDPDWSPDGTNVLVEMLLQGPDLVLDVHWIAAVSWPDGEVTLLSPPHESDEDDYYPVWSPDGTQIAFISTRGDPNSLNLWVMNADGEQAHQVPNTAPTCWYFRGPGWQVLTERPPLIVNTKNDGNDNDPGDGECDTGEDLNNGDAECTFRAAIEEANAKAGKETISFDIPDEGVVYILPNEERLHITDPVIIDGTTQPGSGRVKIHNAWLDITAGSSEVRGLAIHYGQISPSIRLAEGGGNVLEGNIIGLDASDGVYPTYGGGILIESTNNRIGSADHDPGICNRNCNLITTTPWEGNETYGIMISGTVASDNVIQGNFIGTDGTGMQVPWYSTQYYGILIEAGASNNVIGGSGTGQGNLISGNKILDVLIDKSPLNIVQGNLISIAADGMGRIGGEGQRWSNGVVISNAADNQVIDNIISDVHIGVFVTGAESVSNVVSENILGTTADGTIPLGNDYGVDIERNASGTTVENNTIAFNDIGVRAVIGVTDTTIEQNSIRDGEVGVWLQSTGDLGEDPDHIRISGNAIYNNSPGVSSGLGIDLDPLGPNPNDIGDGDSGPNGLLNFPALFYAALTTGGDLRIGGLFDTSLGSKLYTLEFFANQVCDESSYGEGERFLGSVDLKTSLGGRVSIDTTFSLAGVSKDQFITATAIDQDGNTSEFSRCVQALPGTALSANASKGATTLNTNDTQGFVAGDYIRINPGGDNQEDNQVSGFGSLLLVTPLKYDHTAGEPVVIITKRLYLPIIVE